MLWSALTAHSKAVVIGPFDPSIILYVSNQEKKKNSPSRGFRGRQARTVTAIKFKYANTAVIKGGRTCLQGGGWLLTHKKQLTFLLCVPLSTGKFLCAQWELPAESSHVAPQALSPPAGCSQGPACVPRRTDEGDSTAPADPFRPRYECGKTLSFLFYSYDTISIHPFSILLIVLPLFW